MAHLQWEWFASKCVKEKQHIDILDRHIYEWISKYAMDSSK